MMVIKNKKTHGEQTMGVRTVSRLRLILVLAVAALLVAIVGVLFIAVPVMGADFPYFMLILALLLGAGAAMQLYKRKALGDSIEFTMKDVSNFMVRNAVLLVMLLMVIIISVIEPRFVQIKVLRDIIQQSATRLIIALGISLVIITGGSDLSAGRIVGLAAVVSASMMQTATYGSRFFPDLPQIAVFIPVLIAVAVSLLCGLGNGWIVAKLNLPPFIATLAMQVIAYGAVSIYFSMPPNNAQPIGGIREDFSFLGQKLLFDRLPILIPIALVVMAIVWFVLNKTVFGKNVYAIGGNREAAKVSGINVFATLVAVYTIAAGLYGMAGVLEAARTAGATNNYGLGYELDAIAACVVGGVSLNGGVGKISGVVIGVLVFTVINYGLSFVGVNPYWQQIIKGVIIVVAVAIDTRKYATQK